MRTREIEVGMRLHIRS